MRITTGKLVSQKLLMKKNSLNWSKSICAQLSEINFNSQKDMIT